MVTRWPPFRFGALEMSRSTVDTLRKRGQGYRKMVGAVPAVCLVELSAQNEERAEGFRCDDESLLTIQEV